MSTPKYTLHPSEASQAEQATHYRRDLERPHPALSTHPDDGDEVAEYIGPRVRSGSLEELHALLRIDELREERDSSQLRGHPDIRGPAYLRSASVSGRLHRRARLATYWRRHGP